MRTSCLLLPGFLLLAVSAVAADEQTTDQRYLAGLRERGLYRLAETYCRQRLQRTDLSAPQRAELVIEWSRCLADRAAASPPEMREPLWRKASEVVEDFVAAHPQTPGLLLVRFQGALGLLAHGELARQEAQVVADPQASFDEARTNLRAALRQLGELAEEVDRRMQQQALPGQIEPGEPTPHQLTSLKKNLEYELARAFRNQAQCYEAQSADRANSLTQAVQRLQPLARVAPSDPLAIRSRIDLAVSYRLLADYAGAGRQLDALQQLKPPPAVQLRVRAERIRLALATGRLSEATAVLLEGREIDGATSAELDYAWLEAYLAAGRAARRSPNAPQADQWQAKAIAQVERIEQLHGPYWTRRAGMLLARYVQASPPGGDLAMLVRAAESSFRSGQLDDALATYNDAHKLAADQGDLDRAFELGYVAATIEHRRQRHREAMDRYHQIAAVMPRHPKAPEAHLLAIYHAAQLVKQQEGSLDDYADLLQEHLRTWPDGPTADPVWLRLGRLLEHRRDFSGAIKAYRTMSAHSANRLQAVEGVERCCRAWFEQRQAAGEPIARIVADVEQAAQWFESLTVGPQGNGPSQWNPVQRYAALAAARLRLNYTPAGYDRTRNVLTAALEGSADAPDDWKSAVRALLVFSLAGSGRHAEAGEVLAQISAGPPQELLQMLEGLAGLAATAQPQVRRELALLELRAAELLRPRRDQLKGPQRQSFEKNAAQALADAGRTDEALAAFRSLAEAYPRDGTIQEAFATLLLTRTDAASKETALQQWRELEKKSPPRSRRWFLAKYWVARLHCDMGNRQQAAKIIRLLQLLHPDCGGPEMKRKFDELLRKCSGP
ncbi:MAG: hypothetical protein JXB62_00530 [Pirellulales bacterium]|nr:hypothetical protein [Pirellulales bacterium]